MTINKVDLNYAKAVIQKEIDGLQEFKNSMDENFMSAVDLFYNKKGHVILSGIGKPGHICKKISTTMSSTGTPSFFLHPAEASHGDLGVISEDDTLLVFSFSGNTQELIPMLNYANRFGVDIVAVTSNKDSVLAKSAKIKIIIPKIAEACPYNLAPTTSTTIMIALGDALALCLLEKRGFKSENFKNLHPGGALGKQLLTVKDLMHTNVPVVRENELMKSVLVEMTEKSFGCVCVVNSENKIVGVITDGDLRRTISNNFLEMKAGDIMSTKPKLVHESMIAQAATKLMNDYKITSLFVEKNMKPQGILHIHDCLRAGLA